MKAAEVASALGTRKTVRITYQRSTETYRVDLCLGRTVLSALDDEITDEGKAETRAAFAALLFGHDTTRLDVTREDVP